MPLNIGEKSVATLTVLDQNGQPITGFDFGANPPTWSITDTTLATIATDPTIPGAEDFTGIAAGTESWSVSIPNLSTVPATSGSFTVAPAPQVPTSLEVTFNPSVA